MKQTILLLISFCTLNSVFAQWQPAGATTGSIYYINGNVGIGTNNPGCQLDVNGLVHTNNLFVVDQNSTTGPGGWFRGTSSGSGNIILQSNAGNGVAFWLSGGNQVLKIGGSGGTEPVQGAINVDASGNVGIKTLNTSAYTFSVNGTAVFDGVTVTTFSSNNPKATPWADYVFDKDYQLPSLQSVAAYIAANHHLDGIPTTAEVKKNGLDLGTNQAKLLEKIEQLTLYTIQLQQQVDSLKAANAKIADLQERLEELETRIQ